MHNLAGYFEEKKSTKVDFVNVAANSFASGVILQY